MSRKPYILLFFGEDTYLIYSLAICIIYSPINFAALKIYIFFQTLPYFEIPIPITYTNSFVRVNPLASR